MILRLDFNRKKEITSFTFNDTTEYQGNLKIHGFELNKKSMINSNKIEIDLLHNVEKNSISIYNDTIDVYDDENQVHLYRISLKLDKKSIRHHNLLTIKNNDIYINVELGNLTSLVSELLTKSKFVDIKDSSFETRKITDIIDNYNGFVASYYKLGDFIDEDTRLNALNDLEKYIDKLSSLNKNKLVEPRLNSVSPTIEDTQKYLNELEDYNSRKQSSELEYLIDSMRYKLTNLSIKYYDYLYMDGIKNLDYDKAKSFISDNKDKYEYRIYEMKAFYNYRGLLKDMDNLFKNKE